MRIRTLVGLSSLCAGTLMAQGSTPAAPPQPSAAESPFRDPVKAAVFGTLFPGAGHVYSTEYMRGVGIYFGAVGSIGLGALVYEIDKCTFAFLNPTCNPGPQWPHRTLGLMAIGVGVATWGFGAADAPRAARRANANRRRKAIIRPRIEPRNSKRTDVGVTVSW